MVPAAGVVGEAMVMLTLADFALDKLGGDSLAETVDNLARYRDRIAAAPAAPVAGGRARKTSARRSATSDDAAGVVGSGGDD